ncbi:MAG: DeoR/GlpR family DNA-binding transcription regulator [Lachnospiraceae bacterium]|nr:DeoR/GlpR family DNA-binding transcription regulator [Lachnospiraceae bacterium]MDD6504131.1 DeoR/GlpR family DNA-binding transcription regulator [Lachnospiraceae bacterium]
MLAEQRYKIILDLLEKNKSVTVTEIREALHASESTVRRDITALHNASKLIKVFGGAVSIENNFSADEPTVAQKADLNREEKQQIGRYAASLIGRDEFVYIDAGTSTGSMLEYIDITGVSFVTNAVAHAQYLAARGAKVYLLGGELKSSTEAIVGNTAVRALQGYHFTKGFFGTNGISRQEGFSTPDADEAIIKETAMGQCRKAYVLADSSKFNNVSSVTFANIEDATILTDQLPVGYENYGQEIV